VAAGIQEETKRTLPSIFASMTNLPASNDMGNGYPLYSKIEWSHEEWVEQMGVLGGIFQSVGVDLQDIIVPGIVVTHGNLDGEHHLPTRR